MVKRSRDCTGVGGSARNVARIHQSEHSYPIGGVHNYTMSLKDIDEVYDIIRKSSRDDLTNLDGLSRDRVDIILPAVSVFKTLLRKLMLHNSLSQETVFVKAML